MIFRKRKNHLKLIQSINPDVAIVQVYNKIDKIKQQQDSNFNDEVIFISTKEKYNIEVLKNKLVDIVVQKGYQPHQPMVSNGSAF